MIDLHTHLLPDWDDGAKDWNDMIDMCNIAYNDGIKKLVLTPHIFKSCKYEDNFKILENRFQQLKEYESRTPLSIYRGAEVLIHHDILDRIHSNNLSINSSNYFLIEFQTNYINSGIKDLIFKLMLKGLIPIICHPERNHVFVKKPDILYDLIEIGCFAQITAQSLLGFFGKSVKNTARFFIRMNLAQIIASDAHDAKFRPPKLSEAVDEAALIVGREKALAMVTKNPQAILDNKPFPYFGEPQKPKKLNRFIYKAL